MTNDKRKAALLERVEADPYYQLQLGDFFIGLEFMGDAGFWYRCTDVGTRTILAIMLDKEEACWYVGPPYSVEEIVFDEEDIPGCHLTFEQGVSAAILASDTSGHPGFLHEDMRRMYSKKRENLIDGALYRNRKLLQLDRLHGDGEILHPYAANKEGDNWVISVLSLFTREFLTLLEDEFIRLPVAKALDVRRRADRDGEAG